MERNSSPSKNSKDSTHEFEIHPDLEKKLKKLSKNNKNQFEQILNKIDQIIQSKNLNHYKNLRRPLQEYKRVHVNKSFVLTFKISNNTIIFRDYAHHDYIYKV